MRNQINNYSNLLLSELRAGTEVHSAVSKLKKLLKRRRHESVLRSVLERTEKLLAESRDYAAPTLIVSKEKDVKKYTDAIGKKKDPTIVIDPEMIGGYVLRENYVQEDQSYRAKLLKWYRSTTSQ